MNLLSLNASAGVLALAILFSACADDSDSSSNAPESSVGLLNACKTGAADNCVYSSLTDSRDNRSYKTVKIGNQEWMAENLNVKTSDSYCYNDSAEYCEKYGRLYEWTAAKEACPHGWHLPNKDEWLALFASVGDSSSANLDLKSTSGWIDNLNGSDAYGFSMLPGGFRDVGGTYINEKHVAFFWSSADSDDTFAYYLSFVSTSSIKLGDSSMKLDYKKEALSVRCVKD